MAITIKIVNDKWISLYETETVCRKIRLSTLKEYSWAKLEGNPMPWILHLSWDRVGTKSGDTISFKTLDEMNSWIEENINTL
jgi:hypothetical protein